MSFVTKWHLEFTKTLRRFRVSILLGPNMWHQEEVLTNTLTGENPLAPSRPGILCAKPSLRVYSLGFVTLSAEARLQMRVDLTEVPARTSRTPAKVVRR